MSVRLRESISPQLLSGRVSDRWWTHRGTWRAAEARQVPGWWTAQRVRPV